MVAFTPCEFISKLLGPETNVPSQRDILELHSWIARSPAKTKGAALAAPLALCLVT